MRRQERRGDVDKMRAAAGAALVAAVVVLAGCGGTAAAGPAATSNPSNPNSPRPSVSATVPTPAPSTPPPPSATAVSAPSDVCDLLSLGDVRAVTGLHYTHALPQHLQGYDDVAECVYADATKVVDADLQLNVAVIGREHGSKLYETYLAQTRETGKVAPLPGFGRRAFSSEGVVAADYGQVVIVVDDLAQVDDQLDLNRLELVLDAVRTDLGLPRS